jgi:DNA-binding transcriptional MerR regulator
LILDEIGGKAIRPAEYGGKAMEKSPEAFRTIREVAETMDLPQHVLRFWETRFPQIRPLKRAGGRRYYRPDDVERLRIIKRLLYDEGYTIKGVQKLFKEQGAQNLANLDARLPFDPAEPPAHDAGEDLSREPEPEASAPTPPLASPLLKFSSASAAPHLSADDLAVLRGALADIREAQRILSQAGPQQG